MVEVTPEATLDPQTKAHLDAWLSGPYDEESKEKIRELLKSNPSEITDAFYKNLTFGTGGMRGLLGVGSNRMNVYTIRNATQGLANYLLSQLPGKTLSVLIGYDSRHRSKEFAEETARVLAGNGIKAYLSIDLRPTPWVSFGCRFKKCDAGIMITASHNPPEYSGYKVYWSDGAQVLPPHDQGIIDEVNKITSLTQVKRVDSLNNMLVVYTEDDVDDPYLGAIKKLALNTELIEDEAQDFHIVYTSLHGTGITLAPRALRMCGFTRLSFVDSQITPNGSFPTIRSPDPGNEETLELGIKKLIEKRGRLLIAHDPDADRVGVVAMHEDIPFKFTGNQVACLCAEYLCKTLTEQQKYLQRGAFVKTIVTTELFRAIVERYKFKCFDVLTGFKYIAEKIREWEKDPAESYQYIFGAEESYGYLFGTGVRDKDAIGTSTLIAEVALSARVQEKTLVDLLHEIYETYGIYSDITDAILFEDTKEGRDKMEKGMHYLRTNPFNEIEGYAVIKRDDYLTQESLLIANQEKTPLTLPVSDVLIYWLEEGGKLMIRPSGTEAKIKVYSEIIQKEFENITDGEKIAEKKAKELIEAIKELLTNIP